MARGDFPKLLLWVLTICGCVMESKSEECPTGCVCSPVEGSDDEIAELVSCNGIFPSRVPRTANFLAVSHANMSTLEASDVLQLGNLSNLHIISSGISSVEEHAFSSADIVSLRDLRLSDNEISSMENGTFANLQKLEELFLDGNNIRSVSGILQYLTKLQILHLEDNYLEQIPGDLPVTLIELYLNDNNIHTVQFLGTSYPSLKQLDLCENSFPRLSNKSMSIPSNLKYLCLGNQFYDIDPLIFSSINSSLQTLVLKTTKKLTSHALEAINTLHELKSLTISGAKIVTLSFKVLPKLQSLSLINMKGLPHIDEGFFSFDILAELDLSSSPDITKTVLNNQVYLTNLVHLKTLKVRNTSISKISDDIIPVFQKLDQVDISDNPLSCDCNLNWIIQSSLARKLYLYHSEKTRCLQESTLETRLILDKQLHIPNCDETAAGKQSKEPDSSKVDKLFYIIVCLIIVVLVLFIVIFYILVKYLKLVKRKRCRVSTIF